jgi:arylsulfatase A-like enzyme
MKSGFSFAAVAIYVATFTVSLACAAEPAPRTPNVLFCIADDASPHFGVYGCTWAKTPNIDRLAAQGLVFDNAYTPTAKCAPSRAAILTGRNPWQLEEAANHQSFFPHKYKAFTEGLAEAGIHTGADGKFWGPGDAKTADGKPRTWGLASIPGAKKGGDGKPEACGERFQAFLKARPAGKPFFYWFGSTNPHRPYALDSGISAGKKPSDIDRVPKFWPDNDTIRRDMLDYAIEIEAYDAQVGAILDVLEKSGEAENTLVVVTSDHGMPFPRVKGHNYEMSNHVPLVARWPSAVKRTGARVSEFVSFVDLAPTILEVLGVPVDRAGMSPITGASFTGLLKGTPLNESEARDRSIVILGRERNDVRARPGTEAGLGYPVRGIREGNLLYLHNFEPDRWPCGNVELGLLDTDGGPTKKFIEEAGDKDRYWQFCFGKRPREELFDLSADPDCANNLVAEGAKDAERFSAAAAKLKERLFAELKRQNDPRILGRGAVFDEYPTAKRARAAGAAN